jgi:hypothetical protein
MLVIGSSSPLGYRIPYQYIERDVDPLQAIYLLRHVDLLKLYSLTQEEKQVVDAMFTCVIFYTFASFNKARVKSEGEFYEDSSLSLSFIRSL